MTVTVDFQTFNQLIEAGFVPSENMEHPTALDILKQMPGATLKTDGSNWTAISADEAKSCTGDDAHRICAELYLWINQA